MKLLCLRCDEDDEGQDYPSVEQFAAHLVKHGMTKADALASARDAWEEVTDQAVKKDGPNVTHELAAVIERAMDAGATLAEACREALLWIKREERAYEVLEAIGPQILGQFWHRERAASNPSPGRRVPVGPLNTRASLLESLHKVGDDWKRLGDLTRADCRGIAQAHEAEAAEKIRIAQIFNRLASQLSDTQRVRDRYTADAIARVFKEQK